MKSISRDELRRKLESSRVTLIEVLDTEDYRSYHLPGAINIPMRGGFDQHVQTVVPGKHEPVVVYCLDRGCDASPKAGHRMEGLGYDDVYNYEAGKVDWKDAGLPVEH